MFQAAHQAAHEPICDILWKVESIVNRRPGILMKRNVLRPSYQFVFP
jgi:hypothetical protein